MFSLASHDAVTPRDGGGVPLAGIVPSNQCQESWHKLVKKLLEGELRASTADVLLERLPTILRNDAIAMPDQLCFQLTHYSPHMLKKAVKLLSLPKTSTHIHVVKVSRGETPSYFVLRFKSSYDKITQKLVKQYNNAMRGEEPGGYTLDPDEDTPLEHLKILMRVCSALHWVTGPELPKYCYPSKLNPAHLVCTCKSSRSITLCSHIIAVTALCVPGTYDIEYLKSLLENLAPKGKKAAHRPGNALGGQRIQPQGDSEAESDSSDGEDEDEGFSGDEDDPGPATERAEQAEAEAAGLDEAAAYLFDESETEPESEPPSEPESSDSGSDTEPPSEAE